MQGDQHTPCLVPMKNYHVYNERTEKEVQRGGNLQCMVNPAAGQTGPPIHSLPQQKCPHHCEDKEGGDGQFRENFFFLKRGVIRPKLFSKVAYRISKDESEEKGVRRSQK